MNDLSKYMEGLSPEKRELFELLMKEKKASRSQPISRRKDMDGFPLSFAQERLWFLDQWEPGNPVYNLPQAVHLQGQLNLAALQKTLNEIVRRHETLRATFGAMDGQPIQTIASTLTVSLPIMDLHELTPAEREAEVQRLIIREARQPFDLAHGPLLRATLLQLAKDERIMLLTLHHIVSDGWSNGVLVQEIGVLYRAFSAGRPSPLPELAIRYADFAHWQRRWLQGEVLEKQLSYWKRQLAGAPPVLELPTDRPRPPYQTYSGARHFVKFSKSLTEAIKGLGQREGASLFITLLAAFKVLLYRYTNQGDMVVGSPVANRNRAELEALIGFFVNMLVIRTNLSGNPTLREFLHQVRKVALEAQDYQDLPFEKLVDEMHLERDLSHLPLFQVVFVLQNAPLPVLRSPGVTLSPFEIDSGTAQFDLMLELYESAEGLRGSFQYNTDLFAPSTIARMENHLQTLLASIVANPDQRLLDLSILTEPECRRMLTEWNDTQTDYSRDVCIHQLFEAQVERTPHAIAVVGEGQSTTDLDPDVVGRSSSLEQLTYQELNQQANQLAHLLRSQRVGPGVMVAVCLKRSVEMVSTLLGILKAGGTYVPLEPAFPPARLQWILSSLGIRHIVTQSTQVSTLHDLGVQLPALEHVVCLDASPPQQPAEQESREEPSSPLRLWTRAELNRMPRENLPISTISGDIAYIIFTSGSTGTPKGVIVCHRPVVNVIEWVNRTFSVNSSDRILFITSLCFDLSVYDIFGLLAAGGSIYVASDQDVREPEQLLRLLHTESITFWDSAPAALQQLVPFFPSVKSMSPTDQLRLVFLSGDWIPVTLPDLVRETFPRAQVISLGGATEATIWSNYYFTGEVDPLWTSIPYGKPIQNARYYILDARLNPCPIGVAGDLYIGGECLAWGYANRPALTAEKFIPDPFNDEPGACMYRTGDRACFWQDGTMEFLGRLDHQVKVRGFRVELGEIETVLGQHPGVQEAVVVARDSERIAKDRYLVAYVVPHHQAFLESDELRRYLRERLPEYMIPSFFVLLENLPLTPNRKVDRQALPAPDIIRPKLESAFVAPRTDTEALLANIWSKVLGIEQIGVYDSFFDLGGHSLLATQIIARLRKTVQTDLPLRVLFDRPNIASLAVQVRAFREAQQGLQAPPIVPVSRDQKLPLSFAQEQLWVVDQLAPGNVAYSIPATARVKGPLNLTVLQQCFDTLLQRHEIFRTTYAHDPEHPIQIVHPTQTFPLTIIDVRDSPTPEQEAQRVAAEVTRQPIDLTKSPVVRGFVFQLADEEYGMLMLMPHIVVDEWSTGIILGEMQELYEAFSQGEPAALPELPIQYADYAYWQRHWLRDEVLEATLAYWRQQLADAPASLDLPTDRPRPPVQTFRGGDVTIRLPQSLYEEVLALGRLAGVTPFMTLLATFKAFLHRYTSQTDIVIGTPIANRGLLEVEELVGYFLNVLPLRTNLSGNPTFLELLERVREVCLAGYAHQDLYFERLVQELQPERDPSRNPLFTVMFVFRRNYPMADVESSGLTVSYLSLPGDVARFDLCMYVLESVKGTRVQIIYNSDLFNETTISQMLDHFKTLLIEVVRDPTQRLSDLPLLSESERYQLLVEWNDTEMDYPQDRCIHELFEAQVERTPDSVAVVFENQHLSYQELNRRANQLARYLQTLGVGPETLVGVCVERSLEMVVGLVGILKAGGSYVPLDPAYPLERLTFILEDTQTPVLLAQQQLVEGLPEHRAEVVCLDAGWEHIAQERGENPISEATSENLAHVIYTSGSTGRPKGVVIEHRSTVALIHWARGVFDPELFAGTLASTSICFDLSVFELFAPLSCGGTVILAETALHLPTLPAAEAVTLVNTVPSAMKELVRVDGVPASVRTVNLAGEPLQTQLVEQIYQQETVEQVFDLYGPSEDTTYSTYALRSATGPATIGRPIANTQVYLLDAHLNPVPVGVPGELYIGGDGVVRGYLYRPALTAERFIPDPFSEEAGARLYRTGDLARYLPDGNIEFLGRIDHQVKVRGYRIELGEIEAVLGQQPAVRETVVLAREDEPGDKRLVAYVVPNDEQEPAVNDLRTFLKEELPEYMVPAAFVTLDAFPLTANGKIDRKALPLPEQVRPELAHEYVATRNVVEEVVAHLWAEVLKLDRVGVHDSFFEVGGHSLSAIQILSRLSDTFQTELPLRDLFEEPTVAAVAASLIDNEAKPGQAENIAQIWKRVEMASQEELEEALEQKEREQTMLVSLP